MMMIWIRGEGEAERKILLALEHPTLITENATPVGLAEALPGAAVAISMFAARIDHALGAKWTFPPWSAPVIKTTN